VCPSLDWVITDLSGVIDFNGSASAAAHDEYGLLRARGTAVVTAHFASAAGAAASGAGAQATFDDTLTFSGLDGPGPYILVMHMNVLGVVGGGFLQGVSSAEMQAVNAITPPSGVRAECDLGIPNMMQGTFQATCDAQANIFTVNDVMAIHGLLSIGANAVVPETTGSVTQNPQVNFYDGAGKYTGARYTVYIVDGKGRKVNKAKIMSASGFQYPTH
jgi:hypothetical protein